MQSFHQAWGRIVGRMCLVLNGSPVKIEKEKTIHVFIMKSAFTNRYSSVTIWTSYWDTKINELNRKSIGINQPALGFWNAGKSWLAYSGRNLPSLPFWEIRSTWPWKWRAWESRWRFIWPNKPGQFKCERKTERERDKEIKKERVLVTFLCWQILTMVWPFVGVRKPSQWRRFPPASMSARRWKKRLMPTTAATLSRLSQTLPLLPAEASWSPCPHSDPPRPWCVVSCYSFHQVIDILTIFIFVFTSANDLNNRKENT